MLEVISNRVVWGKNVYKIITYIISFFSFSLLLEMLEVFLFFAEISHQSEAAHPHELADTPAGLATLANFSNGLAKPANPQDADSKGKKPRISKISKISISNAPELKKAG